MSYVKKMRAVLTDVRPVTSVNRRGIAAMLLLLAAAFVAAPAMADLPAAVPPTGGANAGDYTLLLRQYWKSGVAVLVLLVGTWAFIEVGGGGIAKFNEWRRGKVELGELKWYFLIGAVMLVLVIYLLTTANGIL
ncbi:TIGR03745 family integrating conjugative element membrane protein [Janthinobacterium sp. BJB446]|uniref:TIGR03745 family integrating conjugative element membrane protein n=1 Tax=Janthinobacterium sp. BJB446 TaxID=2048009 RepID=UPI000C0F6A37|nr:TIGR03745 family integrating conjugative element membrane protein [Janthinobacterium sp. BJB446]PHV19198.1 TIGR03745 family integrating conjugative element membrane protein [Janthinobacterium sp. BJB446]